MYEYDIRNQIRAENRNKLFGEACVMAVVLIVLLLFIRGIHTENPFYRSSPKTDGEVEELYKKGNLFVEFDSVDLSFTGYYKEDKKGKKIYNCYKFRIEKLDYFVFVPLVRSGEDLENPNERLEGYSFKGKMKQDRPLFEMVAKDYSLGVDGFMEEYYVSPIIMDEVKDDRGKIILVWILFALLLVGYGLYIIWALRRADKPENCRALSNLGGKDEMDRLLDEINKEILEVKVFDTNKIKITQQWFLAFYDGNIIISLRKQIQSVKAVEKVKKAYGISKIGQRYFVEIILENGKTHEIPIEEENDYVEILEILKTNK